MTRQRSAPIARMALSFALTATAGCKMDVEPQASHAIVYGRVLTAGDSPVPDAAVGFVQSFVTCNSNRADAYPGRTGQSGEYRVTMTDIGTGAACVTITVVGGLGGRKDTATAIGTGRVEFREGASGYDSIRIDVRLP